MIVVLCQKCNAHLVFQISPKISTVSLAKIFNCSIRLGFNKIPYASSVFLLASTAHFIFPPNTAFRFS